MTSALPFDLTGRTALVTGASSGIGRGFARIVAAAGANTVVTARRADRLCELADEIGATGGRALAVPLDVSSEESVVAAYDAAEQEFGIVDTVIANAGTNSEGLAVGLPVEEFDAVVATNLRGVFLTTREAGRRMSRRPAGEGKPGRIVIISSVTARETAPGLAAYAATKAGVLQLGRVLAREWAREGINVNIVCPGYIETELTRDWFRTDSGQRLINKFPRRRVMAQDALDPLVLYLSSDACGPVTGSVFTVDDGQTL